MPILLTGFEPFEQRALNPSWLLAHSLHGQTVAGRPVHAVQLPTVFGQSLNVLRENALRLRPRLMVCLGLAAGRAALSIERVALNIDDARIPDNRGAQPIDQPIAPEGPAAYFSTLPIKAMRAAVQAAGVPAEISQTAGTFVCNHVFYGALHLCASTAALQSTRAGFIHIPLLPEMADPGQPSLSLADMQKGLRAALEAAVHHSGADLALSGGAVC